MEARPQGAAGSPTDIGFFTLRQLRSRVREGVGHRWREDGRMEGRRRPCGSFTKQPDGCPWGCLLPMPTASPELQRIAVAKTATE